MQKKAVKIAVIGTGYVGLVSGTCFAELGIDVTCIDVVKEKIDNLKKGIIPIFEPNLKELVLKNKKAGRLNFTTDFKGAVKDADIVFIAVGTPSSKTGEADLTYVFKAAEDIAKAAKNGVVIVTKSTVPVGTGKKVKALIAKTNKKLKFSVTSNPEFLREGAAIDDFMKPDRVIIGSEDKKGFDAVSALYSKLAKKGAVILHTDIQTAELIKYAANGFLATKVAFINEMSDICEAADADIELVAKGIGLDKRISPYFLKVGPGFGGSCFPKDTLALKSIAEDYAAPSMIIDSVIKANDARKIKMAKKIIKECGGSVKDKNIAILGLAFKANTDDMRESAAITIISELVKAKANIKAYDPEAAANAKAIMGTKNIEYCKNAEAAIKGADAIVVVTEWEEFKKIDLNKLAKNKTKPVIIDLRNILPNNKQIKIVKLGKK